MRTNEEIKKLIRRASKEHEENWYIMSTIEKLMPEPLKKKGTPLFLLRSFDEARQYERLS
jgi:hypothetical protein